MCEKQKTEYRSLRLFQALVRRACVKHKVMMQAKLIKMKEKPEFNNGSSMIGVLILAEENTLYSDKNLKKKKKKKERKEKKRKEKNRTETAKQWT